MAHSHHLHREHQVSHRRVNHILKGEPAGAKEHAHSHAFSKVTSKTAAEHHDNLAGTKAPKRFARGGKVKGGKHGHQTNIAIMMPHKGDAPGGLPPGGPGGPPPPMAGPGGPPPGGLPPPPMGGPPMGGPPGMPPGMPMRARGGKIDGKATKGNIKQWSKHASKNSYARGGGLKMKAGASTGVGRLEQEDHMEHKGKKK